jgi:alpha-tubulin suppressor-like RCC1 family protein
MNLISTFCFLSTFTLLPSLGCGAKSTTSISAGHFHTCALEQRQGVDVSGALRCWGQNKFGQASPPAGIFQQVSSGLVFSCAIGLDTKIQCWGQIGGAPSHRGFKQVSAGKSHACALENNGRIHCWGRKDHGETDAPDKQYSQVSCGTSDTCAIRFDGTVDCWGKYYGPDEMSPPKEKFKEISLGSKHRACGITTKGDIKCWGSLDGSDLGEIQEGELKMYSIL